MKKRLLIILVLALALTLPSLSFAGKNGKKDSGPWVHVEVVEDGGDGAKVKANFPLSVALIALRAIEDDHFSDGRIEFDEAEISITDLREMWAELRKAGDAEFVTVEDDGETVKIWREADWVYVHVDGKRQETVRVEVPVKLVDALLSGRDDELDLAAALEELQDMDGEIVRVEDGRDHVRVWID